MRLSSWSSVRSQTLLLLLQASHRPESHQADPSDGAEDREGDRGKAEDDDDMHGAGERRRPIGSEFMAHLQLSPFKSAGAVFGLSTRSFSEAAVAVGSAYVIVETCKRFQVLRDG